MMLTVNLSRARFSVSTPRRAPVQRGEDLGFALEAGEAIRILRECLGQDFEGHVAVEFGVPYDARGMAEGSPPGRIASVFRGAGTGRPGKEL